MTLAPPRLGLRANLPQFTLLVAVNALVGAMVGQERTVVPLLAEQVFAIGAFTASLTFIVVFGLSKAVTNLAAGALSDRYGRKPVLVAGWLIPSWPSSAMSRTRPGGPARSASTGCGATPATPSAR